MKSLILKLIRLYQKSLSPDTGVIGMMFFPRSCRFTPTCSQYCYEAIVAYGIISGLVLGVKRIIRCHPASPGGYDPVKLRS